MVKGMIVALGTLATLASLGVVILGSDQEAIATPCVPGGDVLSISAPNAGPIGKWSGEQVSIAATILNVGTQMKLPARAQIIAVMTGMKESSLTNISHGDAVRNDTIGVFQIGPEHGSHADRMDPAWSAKNFYERLTAVEGWESMEPTLAAHEAQRNADPNAYASLWPDALQVVQALAVPGNDTGATVGAGAVAAATGCDTGADGWAVNAATSFVGPYNQSQLLERAERYVAAGKSDPYFNSVSTWYRMCQHFVANMSGRVNSGYATASDAWAHFVSTGVAHPASAVDGHAPPVGAWLYYGGGGPAGHVAIYLGNGKVASNDTWKSGYIGIGSADDMTDGPWHLTYLGWAAPWGEPVRTVAPTAPATKPAGTTAGGSVTIAHANIPGRSGTTGYNSSISTIMKRRPDFITLNEQQRRTEAQLEAPAAGYDVVRDSTVARETGGSQSLDTAILYNTSAWRLMTSGRVKLVDDDRNNYQGKIVVWDRYATWGMFQRRSDGAIVSVVSTHMPTNPDIFGPNKTLRKAQYGVGMDTLLAGTISRLAVRGPVLTGGDMNVRPDQVDQAWSAPAKMRAARYKWFSRSVDYIFYPAGSRLQDTWSGPIVSDHPYLAAQIGLN